MLTSRLTPIFVLGAAAVAFLLSGVAAAQGAPGPRVGPGVVEAQLVERNAKKLELDEETLAAVKKVREEASAQEGEFETKLREERLKLRDLLSEELPEEAALMKQAAGMSGVAVDLLKHQLATSLRVRNLLTPEQRKELMELRKNVRSRGGRRR